MKLSKTISLFTLMCATAGMLTGCRSNKKITIWTFSDELQEIVDTYYGRKANVIIKGSVSQIQSDLKNAQESGRGIPDIVALEAAVVADFTSKTAEASGLLSLDDIGGADDMYAYTKTVATSSDGKLLGLSWQATPGGFFYKEEVAKQVGINSVEEMEAKISTWSGYLALAAECKTKNIAVASSITDPVKVFLSARENPWVVDNKIQMEEIMFGGGSGDNCFDMVRTLHQSGYTHQTSERNPGWFADIDKTDELGYFCSSWGLNFDLIPTAKATAGKWQMCKAPVNYFKGGTWLAIPQGAAKVDDAKAFIKYITTDKDFLKQRCLDTGDFMNSKSVMQEAKQGYKCEFLNNQNHLEKLYEVAEKINGELISPYDAAIDSIFTDNAANFARDAGNVETARVKHKSNFVAGVKAKYSSLQYDA